ncbi:MAG: transposase, partial [Okeania sp. SIO2F4]|nr:transposase [Okeania sp. SIO2F4]
DRQPGLGTGLVNRRCSSSTDSTRKHTGSMKQLGQVKRSKSQSVETLDEVSETPPVYTAG